MLASGASWKKQCLNIEDDVLDGVDDQQNDDDHQKQYESLHIVFER